MTTRAWKGVWGLGLACLWPGLAAGGQAPTDPSDTVAGAPVPRTGCLQGAPRPRCASFWLVEVQASTTLSGSSHWEGSEPYRFEVDEGGAEYEWNVGHMTNLDGTWAIGGTVSLGTGADDVFTGARARLRRWLGTSASLEWEAGLARSNGNHSWYPAQTGISTGLRFNIQDYGSVFVRYDGFGDPPPYRGPFDPEPVSGGHRHFLRGGVGMGGKATLVGTAVAGLAYAALLGIYLGSGDWD